MTKRLTYSQAAGTLLAPDGFLAVGYAGYETGKNNPTMQHVPDVGPLPRGLYRIVGEPFEHERCGQFCLRLEPDAANEMFGRAGFLLHGDNGKGTASHGCIVQDRKSRELVWSEGYREIEVVE